jgi:putative AlgH/UPF0301 family transcriptional regulator
LISGYSGWGSYQLSRELLEGLWWVVAASDDWILDNLKGDGRGGEDRWRQVLELANIDADVDVNRWGKA